MDGSSRSGQHVPAAHVHSSENPSPLAIARHSTLNLSRHPDPCTICLEPITERAVAVPCNHLTFDFLCLVSWLQERTACPLCNANIREVQYDFRGPQDFKRYHVPQHVKSQRAETRPVSTHRPYPSFGPSRTRRAIARSPVTDSSASTALERRKNVYRHMRFSLRVGANRVSQHQDFTAQDFARSSELQSRARTFLRRELQIFTFLDANPRGGNRDFLIEYIVALLKTNDLKGAHGEIEQLLQEYLGRRNTPLLLHELQAWLRSPYTSLAAWDCHVQY